MARYSNTFRTCLDVQEIVTIIHNFMQIESFTYVSYKDTEHVWEKGMGLLTCPQYMKVEGGDGWITVEAFLKYPVFPGVYVGEMPLKGFWAWGVKALLKKRVRQLENLLQTAARNKELAMGENRTVIPERQ